MTCEESHIPRLLTMVPEERAASVVAVRNGEVALGAVREQVVVDAGLARGGSAGRTRTRPAAAGRQRAAHTIAIGRTGEPVAPRIFSGVAMKRNV